MAPVNHNHLNEITWLKIVHTLMGNFCQESDDKNNMMPMEDMGCDACVIVGCHKLGATNARGVGREQRGNFRGGCMSKLCVE